MKRSLKIMSRLFDAMQRRFKRARPGSVLIMVVSLLVLLALIGTAAMSTARMDRASSAQNVDNTQIDMLAEGVKQMVLSQLVSDLYDYSDTTSSDSFKPYFNQIDSVVGDTDQGTKYIADAVLASRLPERMTSAKAGVAPDPVWRVVSYPPYQNGHALASNNFAQFRFDPPNEDSGNDVDYAMPMYNSKTHRSERPAMQPSSMLVNGQVFPALIPIFADGTRGAPILASDTDGDGIADSLLFRLPISPIRGVVYYAAIRVIDNAAAINLNTAHNPDDEVVRGMNVVNYTWDPTNPAKPPVATTVPLPPFSIASVFPGSLQLDAQIDPGYSPGTPLGVGAVSPTAKHASQQASGDYRNPYTPWVSGQVIGEAPGSPLSSDYEMPSAPVVPNADPAPPKSRQAYWLTHGDHLHHQLGRRLDYPGVLAIGTRFGGGYRPFGLSTSLTLARGFTIVDPSDRRSTVEAMLPEALVGGGSFAWRPYSPDQYKTWFDDLFDYVNGGDFTDGRLRRALLTSLSPVRNTVYRHNPLTAQKYPTKTNLNTADFAELQTSFFDVMCDGPLNTPFDDDAGMKVTDPYKGTHFTQDTFSSVAEIHPSRMFRSPLRPPGGPSTTVLQPFQVMQLRSSLAALNVISLRTPFDVQPQNVTLTPLPGTNGKPYVAHIYGMKKQPFITQIYVNNNPEAQVNPPPGGNGGPPPQNRSGFAAIELYNPYEEPLSMDGYVIRVVDRSSFPSMQMLDLGITLDQYIPPHGYYLIWNFNEGKPNGGNDSDTAEYLPANIKPVKSAGNVYVKPAPTLHNIIGKEMILMRPVGGGAGGGAATDYAPVDSFDLSNLPHQVAVQGGMTAPNAEAWHYVRANDRTAVPTSREWHCVYPGRYDGTYSKRRQQGTEGTTWADPATTEEPWIAMPPATPIAFAVAHPFNSRERNALPIDTSSFPIQIANGGMEQTFQTTPLSPGDSDDAHHRIYFPYNGFARAGDVMQAPFIGSYIIVDPATANGGGATNIVEVNPVTMDAAFAEDTDTQDDVEKTDPLTINHPEDVGRFSPPLAELTYKHVTSTSDNISGTFIKDSQRAEVSGFWDGADVIVYNNDQSAAAPWRRQFRKVKKYSSNPQSGGSIDLDNALNGPLTSAHYTYKLQMPRYGNYAWASDLLDYFTTIHSPGYDFTPNADPIGAFAPQPTPVKNIADLSRSINRVGQNTNPPQLTEDDVPIEGQININTANWKVIAALPLVMKNGLMDRQASENLAKRIVYFRDVDDGLGAPSSGGPNLPHPHGPFKSLMELCLIPQFVTAEGTIDISGIGAEPGLGQGEFYPPRTGYSDGARLDFEKKYLNLTRISNLVTLRSDCYTAYVQVQGWRDAGSNSARLMVQRRLAFIVDRSHVSPTKPNPNVYNVQVPPSGR